MKDAFGGAFMVKIFLVFIVIYVGFIAISLNYAKAFKVKNKIIDYIEENEITSISELQTGKKMQDYEKFLTDEILGNMNYNLSERNICDKINMTNDAGRQVAHCNQLGIVIREAGKAKNTKGMYYEVSTYVGWSLPFLNNILTFGGRADDEDIIQGLWKISGETRVVVREK